MGFVTGSCLCCFLQRYSNSTLATLVYIYSVHRVLIRDTTAFNAFISTTVVVAQISYAIPSALLLYRRRSTDYLPPSRPFKLINSVGYIVNIVTIVWAVVLTVFFSFPTVLPATGGNMSMLISLYISFLLLCSIKEKLC